MVQYQFRPGQRVWHNDGRSGEVMTCVPGNGSIEWYFVHWDDGTEERHTADELEAAH